MTDERLQSYVKRFAALLEEAENVRADQKDLANEIRNKGDGINPAHVRKLAALTISDKKVTKLRADNAAMDRYNRESGAGLDLGLGVVEIAPDTEKQDARVLEAIAMLRDRKSIRMVCQALNMGHGTVQRLRAAVFAVPNQGVPSDDAGTGTPHDPETGEITETDRASNARRAPEGGGEGVSSSPDPITPSAAAASSPKDEPSGRDVLAEAPPSPSATLAPPERLPPAAADTPHPADASHVVPIRPDTTAADLAIPPPPAARHAGERGSDAPRACGRGALMTPYRPTSGTEGAAFMERFCDRCEREAGYRLDPFKHDACPIAATTMALRVTDPGYPKEWVEDDDGPRCTAFQSAPAGEGA